MYRQIILCNNLNEYHNSDNFHKTALKSNKISSVSSKINLIFIFLRILLPYQ